MSPARVIALAASSMLASAVGCAPNGEGRVDVRFVRPECPPGTTLDALRGYGWDAGYFATERFGDDLIVQIQRHNVDIVEGDSVSFRLELEDLRERGVLERRGDFFRLTASPTPLSLGFRRSGPSEAIELLLGVYSICERFPDYVARAGTLELDALAIRIDGADTGEGERVAGRVRTATLTAWSRPEATFGVLDASFDFEPPRRPLREFE